MNISLCLFLITAIASKTVAGQDVSLWDVIPGTAQIKSLFQLIAGDPSGAAITQSNFFNEGLGTAQLRSAYFLVTGEPQKALDIQKKFVSNMEVLVDSLPVLGHLKGGIHLLVGDNEHGWNAIKSATSTSGTVLGATALGPVGALGGRLLTDSVITLAGYAFNGNRTRPHGVLEYLIDISKKDAGEHFDALAGLALDTWAGFKVPKVKKNSNAVSDQHGIELSRWTMRDVGGADTSGEMVDPARTGESVDPAQAGESVDPARAEESVDPARAEESEDLARPELRQLQKGQAIKDNGQAIMYDRRKINKQIFSSVTRMANAMRASKFYDFLENDPKYAAFRLKRLTWAELERRSFDGLNAYADESALNKIDVDAFRNDFDYLGVLEKRMITREDFRTVNTGMIEVESFLSTLAGILGEDVGALKTRLSRNPARAGADGPWSLKDRYFNQELARRQHIKLEVSEDIRGVSELDGFIADHADFLNEKSLIMTEETSGTGGYVHAYALKIKTIGSIPGYVKLLVDYSVPGFLDTNTPNPCRFTSFVKSPDSSFRIYTVAVNGKRI